MAWYDKAFFYHIYPLGLCGAPKSNSYGEEEHRLRELWPWVDHLKKLRSALDARDLNAAFEEAHALKGVLANLEMTPVLTPITEITELLRARKDMDYDPLLEKAEQEMAKLLALING